LPLSLVIPARHGLPLETVMHYALQMADAVAHAHSRGVVHRDLKSTNVMIGTNGDVKILDFGLAIREPAANAESETTRSESPSGAGTVPYMAPEILCGRRATPQSDIWALGVLLFEMLAGVRPFCGATRYELAAAILDRPPAPLPAQVPASLRRAVARCLEKQACQRFASAHQLAAALDNVPVRRPENCADTSV
jgi:serine/threonine protein kinase